MKKKAKKVLIVDDNSANLYLLKSLLEGEGLEVIAAENGQVALDKAHADPPDLIVADILMPVMDGYNLCRQWKSDDILKHIPFVFYTATYTGTKNEDFALSLGADRFILKPQEPDILMNILEEILEENYVAKQVVTKPLEEEMEFFRQYNEILFKKLEKKMLDLEISNQELRTLEERYRLSFENVSDVICTIDVDLNIISVSPSMEKILGYKPQDFIGRSVSNLAHIFAPESFEQAAVDISLILKGDTISATIYQFITKNGAKKYGEVTGSPIMREGKIIGMISVARDITDRNRAEEVLQALTLRQEAILAAVPEIIMEVDNNKIYTWANSVGVEFFGEDVIGKEAAFYFEGEQNTYDTVRPLFKGADDIIYLESWQRRKDGEKRLLAWWCRVLRDESGQVTGALSSARDITERKQEEEALAESEKKYRDLFDFLPIPVYEMDFEANIISANRAIYETFKGTEEDLKKGFKALKFLSPEDKDKSSKNIERLLRGEKIRGTEYTLNRLDGSVFPGIVISSVIYSNDKPVGLRGAIIDITERNQKDMEIQMLLKSVEEERNRLSALINSMVDEIWFTDTQKRFTLANPSALKRFGIDPGKIIEVETFAKSLLVLRPDGSVRPVEEAPPLRALSGEVVMNLEELVQIPTSGELQYRQVNATPVINSSGDIIGAVAVVRDITERKRAEETLEKERILLRNLIDNVPDRIYAKDSEGRFIICNEAMIHRMGKTSNSEIEGKSDFDLLPLEMAQQFQADEQAIIQSGIPMINREEPLATEDGTVTRWNLASKVPLLDKQGNRIGIVGVGREITELKQAQQKLQETLGTLRKAVNTTIQVMVSAVEARDPYTAGHQVRVADLARAIATDMGLPQDNIEGLRMAGSIHDIGKLSIPAEILSKPTKLSEIEFSLIKEHARKGYEILKDVESPWPLAEIVRQHHERMDGSGYPRNLKGEEILIEARILSVADVVEAMASHRPYRPSLGIDVALHEIEKNRGIFYDEAVADACLRLFREKGFNFEGT
jgi:PAS domain S-box-containing protein